MSRKKPEAVLDRIQESVTGTEDSQESEPAERLRIEIVPIDSIHEDPANARTHPTRSIESIKASLARFAQQKPCVVDQNNIVRAGNGTLRAARELGWTSIAIVRSDLSPVEIAAYALSDNQTATNSEWDYERLSSQLRAIQEEGVSIDDLGWEPFELDPLLKADWLNSESPTPSFPASKETETPNAPIASNVRMVQLFLDTTSYPEFASMVETLEGEYQTENATDTVMECLRRATSES